MFTGTKISNLEPLSNWDVSHGDDFVDMFSQCKEVTNLSPITKWNLTNSEMFIKMFESDSCEELKQLEVKDEEKEEELKIK